MCVYPHSIQVKEASGQPDSGSQSPSSARDFRFHLSGTTRTRSHLLCCNCNMSGHDGHDCPRQRCLEPEQPVSDGKTSPQSFHYSSKPLHRGASEKLTDDILRQVFKHILHISSSNAYCFICARKAMVGLVCPALPF